MIKQYVVVGGWIESENDGDIHFVSARTLCELYRVNPDECYLLRETKQYVLPSFHGIPADLQILRPQYNHKNYHI